MLLAIVAKRNWELEQLVVSSDADETQEVINVMEKNERWSWIMDFGCSFHMFP